jgi:penicillin-binding protein 1A
MTFIAIFIIILAAVAGFSLTLCYEISHLPSSITQIENYKPAGRTMIYSSDGVLLANIFQQNRQIVTIDKIPKNLQNATVAIEDSRFYSNVGIDFRGIGRALWKDIRGKSFAQGGSTITQQLVRNLGIGGVTNKKTLTRKMQEALLAIQIERNYSKQQILEMYLNQVYYGSGAYGVQAAAQTYFGKSVDKLDLAECALIAGLPQRPTDYSPYINKKAAKDRRDTVLARMRDLGYITPEQCQEAENQPIRLISNKPPKGGSQVYHAPYFVDYVNKQLSDRFGSDFIYRGGIRVDTTLNWQMEDEAEKDLRQGIANAHWAGATQGALIAMDPATGYIKAMVGGIDYNKSQFNIAADGRRQPGSSFKPIIYTAAMDEGWLTEKTFIDDSPVSFPSGTGTWWTPHNDDGRYRGPVTAKEAVALSINVVAVKILQKLGPENAINYARMMGVQSPLAPYYTLALGASAVTPLEMADVYATIDDNGQRPVPLAITKVTDDAGNVLEDNQPQLESTGIGDKDSTVFTQMQDMLRAVVTEGTAYHTFTDDNPPDAHGKTGTTQDHRDVWFDGFTKKMVCIVWAGHPTTDSKGNPTYGLPMTHEAFGATITAPIWKQFMIGALAIQAKDEAKYQTAPKATAAPAATTGNPANSSAAAPVSTDTPGNQQNGQPDPFANTNTDTTGSTTTPDANAPTPGATATPTDTPAPAQSGTVTVWIDDATGLRAPPNSPDSHQETFAAGTEPTAFAPGYSPSQTQAPTSSTTQHPASGEARSAPPIPTAEGPAAPATTRPVPNIPTAENETAPPPRVVAPAPKPRPRYVTVTVCAESGLRATKWCPETIDRVFPVGQAPTRYCTIHKPPPGER